MWFGLLNVSYLTLTTSIGQILYRNPSDAECSFGLHLIYGVEIILMCNLSFFIGYKVLMLAFDIYEFAINGNLPSERQKKCSKVVVCSIWIISLLYMMIFCFL